jgi:hypothetical protein
MHCKELKTKVQLCDWLGYGLDYFAAVRVNLLFFDIFLLRANLIIITKKDNSKACGSVNLRNPKML